MLKCVPWTVRCFFSQPSNTVRLHWPYINQSHHYKSLETAYIKLFMIYILKTQHVACFGFIHSCTSTPFVRISGINSRLNCSGDPFKSFFCVQLPHTYSNRLCDHCHSLQNTSNVKYYAKTRVCKKCNLTPDLRNVCSLTYPWDAPQTIIVFNIIPDM